MSPFSAQTEDCIRHLLRCYRFCTVSSMTHGLESDGPARRPQHLRLLMDCAAMCITTADALMRKSQFHTRLCELCADICETCARECEALDGMQDCVGLCRTCAEVCRVAARTDHSEKLKEASNTAPA